MRYEDFSCNTLRIGGGKGIPAVGTQGPNEKNVGSLVNVTLTPGAVSASTVADQTGFAVPGVELTDLVVPVRYPTTNHTWIVKVTPTAQNVVTITFGGDATGGTPASGAYTFLVIKTQ